MINTIKILVHDMVDDLERTNERVRKEYNDALTFNANQKAQMEAGNIDEYELTPPERPKVVTVKSETKLVNHIMQVIEPMANAHAEDPQVDGMVVEDYYTPQEIAEQNPPPEAPEGEEKPPTGNGEGPESPRRRRRESVLNT